MPVFVEQRPMNADQLAHFSRVLRDDPDQRDQLARAIEAGNGDLFAGVFNGAPVALVRVGEQPPQVLQLVVHPATRQRGVATEVLRLLARQRPGLRLPPALATLAVRSGLEVSDP